VLSEVRRSPFGPFLDLSDLFPEGVFAYLTLAGFAGVDSGTLSAFLSERGRGECAVHRVEQVHSSRVAAEEESPCEADALVAARPGHAVRVVTADCVPILLASEDGTRVAAVHAGWKGTLARIVQKTVQAFGAGAAPALRAYVGPSVGPCCYKVGQERRDLFREAFPGWLEEPEEPEEPLRLDLQKINALQLLESGLPAEAVRVEARCTACSVGLCCSYRRDGDAAGRMAALIGRTPWRRS
jgi:YfiH family protein